MALWCVEELGMRIVPYESVDENGRCTCGDDACEDVAKHPIRRLAPKGWRSATRERSRITGFFNTAPHMNYGVVSDRMAVVDIDGPKGLREAERLGGRPTFSVRTGREDGGQHRYYEIPEGFEARSFKPSPGLEVWVGNQCVIGPGCKHASGAVYEGNGLPIAPAPD
jgi:hypothetical protein